MRRFRAEARRFLLPVLTLALCAAAVGAVVTLRQPTISSSSVTMVVQTSGGSSDTETLVRTMTALVDSDVLGQALKESVGSDLSAHEITSNLTVERPPGSSVLTVTYSDDDATRSVETAQAIIPVFQDEVTQLEAAEAGQLAPNYAIQPWGGGAVTTTETPAPVLRNALIAALLGLLIGIIGAVLYAQRHALVIDVRDAEKATGLRVVTLPGPVGGKDRRAETHPADVMAALSSTLPAALGATAVPRRLLLVSPEPGTRHSSFAVQFARSLGQLDGGVVLVDADLEDGRLTRFLNLTGVPGLADCLRSDLSLTEALLSPQDGPAAGLAVLPVGRKLPMRSGSAAHVLSLLDPSSRVVVDAPTLSRHQSLSQLLPSVDAVLVLITLGKTSVTDASRITRLLSSLTHLPAATVVLSDRAEQPTRAAGRHTAHADSPATASLPA